MANGAWLGWNGPLFNPVSGVGNDGGNKREDEYTVTLIQVEPSKDYPGRLDGLVWVRDKNGRDLPHRVLHRVRGATKEGILALGDKLTAEAQAQVTERGGRMGRSTHIDRTGPYTGGEGGYTYRSGGDPDPHGADSW